MSSIHEGLIKQYEQDKKNSKSPWEFWQVFTIIGWITLEIEPDFSEFLSYRRIDDEQNNGS